MRNADFGLRSGESNYEWRERVFDTGRMGDTRITLFFRTLTATDATRRNKKTLSIRNSGDFSNEIIAF